MSYNTHIVPGMTVWDLPEEAWIYALDQRAGYSTVHLACGHQYTTWEFREEYTDYKNQPYVWRIWTPHQQICSPSWAAEHGREVTRDEAQLLILSVDSSQDAVLRLPEGL